MSIFTFTTRQAIAPLTRLVAAAALLLMAALPGINARPTASVQSNLMAAGAGTAAVGAPIVSAANFAPSAIKLRHWSKAEVTVHVTPSENDDKTPAEVIEQASKAIGLWDDRFKTVKLTLTASDEADIDITFVQPGKLSGGAVGKTDVRFNPENDEIDHAAIKVNEGLPKAELEQAIGHEMGHALGIQGHSAVKSDLMYPSAHLPVVITDRDVNTLAMGYNVAH